MVNPFIPVHRSSRELIFLTPIFFQPVPVAILKNIFSCWPGLIDLYFLPNKSCGYVKYADKDSAIKAMETLSGAEICGTKIKVHE